MTNRHMRSHPLQDTYNAHFLGVRSRIQSVSATEAEKRKITQQRNTARRCQHMVSCNYRNLLDGSDSGY